MPLIINGQRVEDALLDNEFSQIKAYHESLGNTSCCERDPEFRATARDNIAARVLLAQAAARDVEPTPDAEVDAAVAKLVDEYGGRDWFFMRTGATEEQMPLVRRDVDVDLRVKRMLDRLADADDTATEADLRAHYEQHLSAFLTDEQVRASHILKNPKGEGAKAAYDELRAVRRQLKAGADFVAMAEQHSERGEGTSIDLGLFKRGELAPEFEAVAFSLDVGEISPIFTTQYGMHVITVTEHKPAEPKPFEEVRDEVITHRRALRRDAATRALVERLRRDAVVEEIDAEAEAAAAMA
ncbi:MAG: prsA1 [Phycisphaerales bacterium]|nr:prsA1 [Phycisphaerales bacterium]